MKSFALIFLIVLLVSFPQDTTTSKKDKHDDFFDTPSLEFPEIKFPKIEFSKMNFPRINTPSLDNIEPSPDGSKSSSGASFSSFSSSSSSKTVNGVDPVSEMVVSFNSFSQSCVNGVCNGQAEIKKGSKDCKNGECVTKKYQDKKKF